MSLWEVIRRGRAWKDTFRTSIPRHNTLLLPSPQQQPPTLLNLSPTPPLHPTPLPSTTTTPQPLPTIPPHTTQHPPLPTNPTPTLLNPLNPSPLQSTWTSTKQVRKTTPSSTSTLTSAPTLRTSSVVPTTEPQQPPQRLLPHRLTTLRVRSITLTISTPPVLTRHRIR